MMETFESKTDVTILAFGLIWQTNVLLDCGTLCWCVLLLFISSIVCTLYTNIEVRAR